MRKHHPKNERIKRQYLAYLEEAKRMSTSSVDQVAAAIALFEASTGWRDFGAFHIDQARKFKRLLADAINPETGKPLAKAIAYSRLMALKGFVTLPCREREVSAPQELSGRCDCGPPRGHRDTAKRAVGLGGDEMALDVKGVVDGGVG